MSQSPHKRLRVHSPPKIVDTSNSSGLAPSNQMAKTPEEEPILKSNPSLKQSVRSKDKPTRSNNAPVKSNSPYMPMFEKFRADLDEHHDRRERVIKASRDVTALSKKMFVFKILIGHTLTDMSKHIFPSKVFLLPIRRYVYDCFEIPVLWLFLLYIDPMNLFITVMYGLTRPDRHL
jgi:hypothetical protein